MDIVAAPQSEIRRRVDALRAAMRSESIAAWLLPSADPHLSEYLPDRWQGRAWLTGFTGSVGTLIVTADFAGLWVDSRYWVQAETQTAGTGIEVMRAVSAAAGAHIDWLAVHLPRGASVGVDGAVLSLAHMRALEEKLTPRGVRVRTDIDLLDRVWRDRPALPQAPVREQARQFAPVARPDKLARVRSDMQVAGADWHFISTLDDIAWLFNLRGADVPYNPVFVAHALIGPRRTQLFVGDGKVPPPLADRLEGEGIDVRPYEWAAAALANLPADAALLIDPKRITFGLRAKVPAHVRVIEALNPSTLAKSRKTEGELAHTRRAMEQDGAALAEFFAWFEHALAQGERITELTIDERITAARAQRPGFISPSFATIAGFNANGALPHYRATDEAHAVISDGGAGNGLLLIDSGGQYDYGTTDITRVVPVGATSAEQRRDYTLVLKGMIQLSRAVFPRGTRSPLLDTLARAPIWAAGVDYGHGTGHGVGYALNVHEGPHGITPYLPPEAHTAMEPGMITSNEPGIYRPGRWGVRIENLVLNVAAGNGEFGEFLKFETLTLCPIDTRCIERELMRADEIDWLNAYHAEVRQRLAPLVSGDALAWLERRTQPI